MLFRRLKPSEQEELTSKATRETTNANKIFEDGCVKMKTIKNFGKS